MSNKKYTRGFESKTVSTLGNKGYFLGLPGITQIKQALEGRCSPSSFDIPPTAGMRLQVPGEIAHFDF